MEIGRGLALKRAVGFVDHDKKMERVLLTAEAVQCTSLTLEGVDDVHGCDGLPLSVLGVGDGIADHVLQEDFQHSSGLLVDQARDTLDTTSASQTPDSGLGDTLDVITKHFPVTLSATLSQSFASFTTS